MSRQFYRVARALYVEQSTLSRSIGKLERSLGMPIFERTRAGVKLTFAGCISFKTQSRLSQ
ncbi:LysR family transcriptional regulator [Sphingomonas sp.]|uniref:helix-turn-helix domain-containing protein n=1 Tax=Sphingomonas sp. TaxID=28214 RepID=UPI0035C8512C